MPGWGKTKLFEANITCKACLCEGIEVDRNSKHSSPVICLLRYSIYILPLDLFLHTFIRFILYSFLLFT